MTGPEHYRLAEAALAVAERAEPGSTQEHYSVAAATAHATLALAAATATGLSDMPAADWDAWRDVAATKVPPKPSPHYPEGPIGATQAPCGRCGRPLTKQAGIWRDHHGEMDCPPAAVTA